MAYEACAVYMLTNKTKTVLYTGVTNDLLRRVCEHREGLDAGAFTARYRTSRLVYYEAFDDMAAAIQREKQIKGWARARKNALIARVNPGWLDLWPGIAEV
jgi:putative endonuclease